MSLRYPCRRSSIRSTQEQEIRAFYTKLDSDPIGSSSSAYLREAIKKYLQDGFSMGRRWDNDQDFLQEVSRLYSNKLERMQIELQRDAFICGERAPPPKPLRYRRSHAVQRRLERRRLRAMGSNLGQSAYRPGHNLPRARTA
jgi:hypothetical protein